MMMHRFWLFGLILGFSTMMVVGTATAGDPSADYQATLVWGTNDPKPANSKLKPVDAAVARKLGKLPFKWKYYYSVKCEEFSVEQGKHLKVRISDECEIVVKSMAGQNVELTLRGKGQAVGKVTQKLTKGQMLVTGGNAENFTAWFVVLRRVGEK